MSSTTLPVCPKTGSTSPSLTVHLCLQHCSGKSGIRPSGLQAKLCDRYGLTVTVSHYPPGASKWNPIEHRLFSRLSTNWQGEPLETFEKVLKFIRTTTTDTGLRVRGMLNARCYPKAVKASADEVESLSLKKHRILPQWNYTLTPRAMSK